MRQYGKYEKVSSFDGLFDFLSANKYKSMEDRQVGLEALKFFHTKAVELYKDRLAEPYTFERMIELIESVQGGKGQIAGLGLGIKLVEMSERDVKTAMVDLAEVSKGRIPENVSVFRQALTDEATKLKLGNFLNEVVVKSVIDVGEGLTQVGKTAIQVGQGVQFWSKYSKVLIPVIGISVLGYMFLKYKTLSGGK